MVSAGMQGDDAERLVQEGLAGIGAVDPALAARSARFIVHGEGPEVLLALATGSAVQGALLGHPGRLMLVFDPASLPRHQRAIARAGLNARHALYRRADTGAASIALLARLGKVLAAADQERALDRTGATMPNWLHYLLNDALWASLPDQDTSILVSLAQRDAALLANRPAWDIGLVAALLAHDDIAPALAVPIVFERSGIDEGWQIQVYTRLLAPGTLDGWLTGHPDDVAAAAKSLSAAGRIVLLERINANPALRDTLGAVVAKLAACDSSSVRAVGAHCIGAMETPRRLHLLGALLGAGTPVERVYVAGLLAGVGGNQAIALLTAAQAVDTNPKAAQAIGSALLRLGVAHNEEPPLPPLPPLPPAPAEVLGADAIDLLLANHARLLERLGREAADEIAANRSRKDDPWHFAQQHLARHQAMTDTELRMAIPALNGGDRGVLENSAVRETLEYDGLLASRPDFGLLQLLRMIMATHWRGADTWFHPLFQDWLRQRGTAHIDLRQLATLAEACGGEVDDIALAGMLERGHELPFPQALLPPAHIWPLYAERPALIDEGLGIIASTRGWHAPLDVGCTLDILATFPTVPPRWQARVWELALGDAKTHRARAQQLLTRLPGIASRIWPALASNKHDVRSEAARWLADIGDTSSVPALCAALDKETRATVSAVILSALERLGADMTTHLAPARLLAQARTALKAKTPAAMAWLALDTAPACSWNDGAPVEADIVRWWITLAHNLKEAGASALFRRYLRLLAPASRIALGRWALHQFIVHDREQGAIGDKGLLALAGGTQGPELVDTIVAYMRDYPLRRVQIEALIEAASGSDAPGVIQFVLATARRHRTASVQEKARSLVQNIAERNGWSTDQLADRTVPAAGLDEDGRLLLQYGARQFTVTLDAALKPVLTGADGAIVSALPAPRQDDAPDSLKEAKQQLAACKKELKQVIDMQGARLYDAMCAGRAWPLHEWRSYLLAHPVVGRLVQRLVWQLDTGLTFRPTEDGELIDAADDTVTLPEASTIHLAHAALLPQQDAAAWIRHCKDYKVTPLFAQMTRAMPGTCSGAVIDDRLGWLSDAFTLRTAFTKYGYQRGTTGSGGTFDTYRKPFASAGITVVIDFSGSAVPEENRPAALRTLSFRDRDGAVALDQVPPVLLAEAWADYHAIAACASFDAAWESKVP